jgi:hypothetical protein
LHGMLSVNSARAQQPGCAEPPYPPCGQGSAAVGKRSDMSLLNE